MKTIPRLILVLAMIFCSSMKSQNQIQKKYEATWESIDSRPIPAWFGEAKFGIFIHWGPYSVPAWSPKGTYSEWYQYWLQSKSLFGNGKFKGDEVANYHAKTYGEDFDYYKFGEQFKADLFNCSGDCLCFF